MNQGKLQERENPTMKILLPQKERELNAMDVDRLMVNELNKLIKEGGCFRCRNTGHQANKCPEDDNRKKGKEVPKNKMNRRELHAHVRALFKEILMSRQFPFLRTCLDYIKLM
jgi:Zinc knuckle